MTTESRVGPPADPHEPRNNVGLPHTQYHWAPFPTTIAREGGRLIVRKGMVRGSEVGGLTGAYVGDLRPLSQRSRARDVVPTRFGGRDQRKLDCNEKTDARRAAAHVYRQAPLSHASRRA